MTGPAAAGLDEGLTGNLRQSMSIELFLILALAAVAGGVAGWWARGRSEKLHRRSCEAHESEIARATARARDRARDEKAAAEERMARLREQYQDCAQRLAEAERRLEQRGEFRPAGTEVVATVATHGPAVVDLPEEWVHRLNGAQDDLTEIRGLGRVLIGRLQRLGISQYRQLARITPDNVGWIAARLNIAPARILKERWALQASQLQLRQPDSRTRRAS